MKTMHTKQSRIKNFLNYTIMYSFYKEESQVVNSACIGRWLKLGVRAVSMEILCSRASHMRFKPYVQLLKVCLGDFPPEMFETYNLWSVILRILSLRLQLFSTK